MKRRFHGQVLPIEPYYQKKKTGRRPIPTGIKLRTQRLQRCSEYSDPAMEKTLRNMQRCRFVGLFTFANAQPEEKVLASGKHKPYRARRAH